MALARSYVSFVNAKENIRLAGTFTFPKGKAPLATVVLISGSGPQNRDEELMGHKPFLVLADYLTRNGIAVLRFDDRGSYASEGNFATATSNDFATDVEAAVAYLKTRKEVNKGKIGLMGHSEGGLIAPMVAVRNKDVNFIVLMAGPGIRGSEIMLRQQALIGRANGVKEEDLKQTIELNAAVFKMVDEIADTDTLRVKISNYLREQSKTVAALATNDAKKTEEMIESQLEQLLSPWMLNFIRYNPSTALEKVKCPVLAINGSKDLQVPSEVNLNAIETALNKAKNKNFVIKELAGLNHLFQECKTGSPNEYAGIEQTISPSALEVITQWIGGLK
jgi:pimeloyl-ACP methyl ester carboxylesterase